MAKAPDTIQKQYTNPLGILGWRYPNRNHKKMVVIDRGIAYIGGINFSDHNFKWPDMMIRLTDPDMVTALREDFLSTWNGKNQSKKLDCQRGALYFLDGAHSFNLVKDLIKQIESATGSIDVVSPYLGHPFIAPLLNASKKGVKVRILLPLKNNKIWVNESLMGAFSRHSVQILFLPEMIHLKAILLDKSVLVTGSFNFDIVSCCFEQEVVLSTRDPVLVESFRRDILRPFLKKSVSYDPQKTRDRHYNRAIYAIITVLSVLILFLCRGISIVRRYPIPRSNRVRHR